MCGWQGLIVLLTLRSAKSMEKRKWVSLKAVQFMVLGRQMPQILDSPDGRFSDSGDRP